MKKIVIATVGIIIGLGLPIIFILSRNQSIKTPVVPTVSPTVMPTAIPNKKYTDPAGFNFEYPQNYILTPKIPLPASDYASIDITTKDNQATINLHLADSPLTKVDSLITATQSTTLKLADLSAVQFTADDKLTTVALDQGVQITITLKPASAGAQWRQAYNQIVKTFQFSAPTSSNASTGGSDYSAGDDVIFEGEEVVE